ncbi:MAG: hypothetical protein AAF587_40945 [Bacteroidota bacterium]
MKEGRIHYEYWDHTLRIRIPWRKIGREILVLGPETLLLRKQIFGIGKAQIYPLDHIVGLTFVPADSAHLTKAYGKKRGLLFSCYKQLIPFGKNLSQAEGKRILELMEMTDNLYFKIPVQAAIFKLYPF